VAEPTSASRVLTAALHGADCRIHGVTDRPLPIPIDRWRGVADASDVDLVDRCLGPTIDVGCGPGRLTYELLRRGHYALGIDVTRGAVDLAQLRGAVALRRDVFQPVPGEGRWQSALLADGNVGIGGDPVGLLRRVGELISRTGRVVVEVAPNGDHVEVKQVSLSCGQLVSRPFQWAFVPASALEALAERASLRLLELSHAYGRTFGVLEPVTHTQVDPA
jgi:SAM-dependent methyltransferase